MTIRTGTMIADDHHDYDYFRDDGAGQNSTDAGELTD